MLGIALAICAGCAFDLIHVRQVPAQFDPTQTSARSWTLAEDVKVSLPAGSATTLKKGTTWFQVGRVEQGDVFRTKDQIVTVEASNVHEAQPVIRDETIVGFYLPVERTFAAAETPKPIQRTLR